MVDRTALIAGKGSGSALHQSPLGRGGLFLFGERVSHF